MTPLKQYWMALGMFVASSFPIAYLSLYVHEGFLILLLANVLFWSWRAKSIRCAHCGCPVAPPIGASVLAILKSIKSETCRECGAKLD